MAYKQTKDFVSQQAEFISDPLAKIKEMREANKPSNGIAYDNTTLEEETIAKNALTPTDEQPISTRPIDVYVDIPETVAIATEGSSVITYVEKSRTWSDNAMKYGLSLAIRLDELWPNAINAFKKNPLLGSGYATLNKKEFYQFTEAESTDNNFLRTLGETGLLGFISFYGTIVSLLVTLYKNQKNSKQDQVKIINIAFIAASIGLLLNATYIDVFASSKVAFTYWALAGAILAYNYHVKKTKRSP
jgi:hypothetical protein